VLTVLVAYYIATLTVLTVLAALTVLTVLAALNVFDIPLTTSITTTSPVSTFPTVLITCRVATPSYLFPLR
jgi:hypothetical protein